MPLYEYECPEHGRFELVRKFADPPLTKCPQCGKKVEKVLSAPAFQFKGTGWYVTDYAKKSGGESKDGKGKADGGGKEAGGATDSTAKDSSTKEATKTASKAGTGEKKGSA
ncbi:MAG TPA: zinc ribbon domain-containing protein [Vicinamibacteria bacterium]